MDGKYPSCVPALIAMLTVGFAGEARGQDTRQPDQMGLPQANFQMPDTTRLVLENGLIGFVVPDVSVPLVSLTAFMRGGVADDRVEGAAEMLAMMMLTRGPCWLGPGRFQETLDELDAQYRVAISPEMMEISMSVAASDAGEALRIFSGIIREPCIDETGLDAFRMEVARAASVREAVPDGSLSEAVSVFKDRLYGDHEYRRRVTVEDAAALRLEDVERFHREHFIPGNVVLAVAGAFEWMPMARTVDQRFADWQPRRPPAFSNAESVTTPEPREVLRVEVDKLQTWVVIGHELPPMSPSDLVPVQVMNYILGGGHFDTRLFREARDRRGLTNDASGVLEPSLRGPGTYTFQTSARNDVVDELVDVVLGEINRIRTEPVTEEELAVAKGALIDGAFPMLFENGHATARTFALEWARYLTFDHLAAYRDRVQDVSVRDVQRAAERYLRPERMRIVLMGPDLSSEPEF